MISERLRIELDRDDIAPDVQLAVALSAATRIEAELVRWSASACYPTSMSA